MGWVDCGNTFGGIGRYRVSSVYIDAGIASWASTVVGAECCANGLCRVGSPTSARSITFSIQWKTVKNDS